MVEPVVDRSPLAESVPGAEVAQYLRLLVSQTWDLVVNNSAARMAGGKPRGAAVLAMPGRLQGSRPPSGPAPERLSGSGSERLSGVASAARWLPAEHLLAAEQLLVAAGNRLSRALDAGAGDLPFLAAVRLASPPQLQPGIPLEVIARQMTQAAERFARIVESMSPEEGSRRWTSESATHTLAGLVSDIMARVEVHLHAVADAVARPASTGGSRARLAVPAAMPSEGSATRSRRAAAYS
ncbi:MAG: hypothetical protein M0035_13545 [Actinomycetota bacterium]|nr:hypothetical protein [Actinomycetota bacterium]